MPEPGDGDPHAQIARLEAQLEAERAERQAEVERAASEHAGMQARLDALESKLATLAGYLPETDVIQAVYNRGGSDARREMDTTGQAPPRRDRGHLRRIVGAVSFGVLLRALFRHGQALAAGTASLGAAAAVTYVLAPAITSPGPHPLPVTSAAAGSPPGAQPAGGPAFSGAPPAATGKARPPARPSSSTANPAPSPSDDARVSGGATPSGSATPPPLAGLPGSVPVHGTKHVNGRGVKPTPVPSPTAVPSLPAPSFTPPAVPSPTWLPSALRSLKDPDGLIVL
jgi:hypothetical protein